MVYFAETNQAPLPYSLIQHIGMEAIRKACANKLSQILTNNSGNGDRGISFGIYVRYCIK